MTLHATAPASHAPFAWQGQWLWLPDATARAQTTVLFRRTFDLDAPASTATLRISAAHIYRLYLNGHEVGRGPARSDPRFRYYDSYDVGPWLRTGANQFVCLVHHMQPFTDENPRQWNLYDGPGGLLAELELDNGGVASDEQWQVVRAPGWRDTAITAHRFHPAIHDVDVPTFNEAMAAVLAGKDDLAWQTPRCTAVGTDELHNAPTETGTPRLRPIPHQPVRYRSTFNTPHQINPRPKSVFLRPGPSEVTISPSPEGGWLTYDLPHPMAGGYALAVRTDGEACLDIYCGEGSEAHLADRLHVRGTCRFQPMDWRGGDRVEIHVRDATAPVVLEHFHFIEWRYPYEKRGSFQSSNDLLDTIWRVCQRTAWLGTQDHLVDCVWREQAMWIEDIYIHAQAIRAAFGDMRPVGKALRQALQLIDERGIVPVPGPAGLGYRKDEPTLRWSTQPLTLPLTAREHFWYTADEALAAWCVSRFERLLGFYAEYEDARGLLRTDPADKQALMAFGGWDPGLRVGVATGLNSQYAFALAAAAELAGRVGRTKRAEEWQQRSERAIQSLRETFWDDHRCVLIDGERDGQTVRSFSLMSNAWAALAGVVPQHRAGAWGEAMRNAPATLGTSSPYDASVLLMAYAKMDLELHVRDLLENYYGSIIHYGHVTLPEYWRARDATIAGTQQDSSRCHAYGAGPAYVSHDYILGVQPLEPGYRELLIRPRPAGLHHASGTVPTPAGDVTVQWRRDPTEWEVIVQLPTGVAATVQLPWHREALFVNDEPVFSAPRWSHAPALARRAENVEEPRIVRHRLDQPGRHIVRLAVQ